MLCLTYTSFFYHDTNICIKHTVDGTITHLKQGNQKDLSTFSGTFSWRQIQFYYFSLITTIHKKPKVNFWVILSIIRRKLKLNNCFLRKFEAALKKKWECTLCFLSRKKWMKADNCESFAWYLEKSLGDNCLEVQRCISWLRKKYTPKQNHLNNLQIIDKM